MAQQDIDITAVGDTLPAGGAKINANFAEVRAELVIAEAAATTAANVAAQASADAGAATAAVATATADAAAAVAAVAAATAASDAAVAAVAAATANNAVTDAKLRDSAAVSVIGRSANSSGDPADIAAGSNDTLLRRVSDVVDFGQVTVGMVPNDLITYAKLQNVSATSRILGRLTSGAGDAEELTGTQATTLLDAFTSSLKGLAPASGGGTSAFLRADGLWSAPPTTAYNPATSGLTATTYQNAIDEILSKRIAGAVLLSARYGFVGDATTDNNTAILAWIAAGTAMLATYTSVVMELVPEATGNIFATTGRHVFPAGLILVMKGGSLLKATGTDQTAPLITHSDVAYDLAVDDGVTHNRTNRNHIGVRTLNVNGRYMTVRDIRGFTIGHQLAATTFTSPIIVDYGKIGICPYPVECCTLSETSAFVSDNVLRGGEIIPTSSLANYGSFAALTIATEYDAGNAGNSGNYWWKPQVQSGAAGLTWSAGATLVAGRRYLGALTGMEWFCKTGGVAGSVEPSIIPSGSNRVDVTSITTVAGSTTIQMASTTGISAGWHMRGTNPLSNFPFDTYVTTVTDGTHLVMSNPAMSASTNYRAHFIAPTTDGAATLIYVGPYRRSLVWNRDCGSDNGIYNARRETGLGEAILNSGAYLWPLNATGTQTFETTVTTNSNSTTTAKICFFPLWTAATAYAKGDMVRKLLVGATYWECIVAGTSHATTEPTIADTAGTTGTDNTVTWIARAMPTTVDRGDIGVYTGTYFNPKNYVSSVVAQNMALPSVTVDNLHWRGIGSATGWLVQGMQKCTTGGVLSQGFATTDLALSRGGLLLLSTTAQLGFLIHTGKHKSFQINKLFGAYNRQRGHAVAFDSNFVKLEALSGQNAYNPRVLIGDMTIGATQWTDPADTSTSATNMLVGTDTPYVFYGVVKGSTGTPVACTLAGISVTALPYTVTAIGSSPQVQLVTNNGLSNGFRASLGAPTVGFFLSLGEYVRNASAATSADTKGYFVTTVGILAPDWATSTVYVKGQLATAGGNVYAANGSFTSGTTPSGTAQNFLDSTATSIVSGDVATWDYIAPVAVLTADDALLPETKGGTGQSTITQGDLLYGSAANTLAKLAKNASSTRYLSNTGTTNNPAWAQVALGTGVSGFLPQDNGGTQFVRLAADITGVLDDSYKDVTGVSFAILASATYEFEFVVIADVDATTTGIDVSVNGPASPTSVNFVCDITLSTTAAYQKHGTAYDTNTTSATSAGTAARPYRVKGVVVNGANAGTLVARLKRENAVGSGLNARAGSYGLLRRLA